MSRAGQDPGGNDVRAAAYYAQGATDEPTPCIPDDRAKTCGTWVWADSDHSWPWRGFYCKLPPGHEGECLPIVVLTTSNNNKETV